MKAALLIIGDEILSGRTQDKNLAYLAEWLNEAGIQLAEARVIADIEDVIVNTVNDLRATYDYVFTTGGIGPTHDDITSESIAKAFEVPLPVHPEAFSLLEEFYGADEFTPARQRMANIPEGAVLIDNSVSIAPGFQMENVFVMAGVPKIMQAMLEAVRPRLKTGRKIWSETITIHTAESKMAEALSRIQDNFPTVSIGSYPFFRKGIVGTQIVVRSADQVAIRAACKAVQQYCDEENFEYLRPDNE